MHLRTNHRKAPLGIDVTPEFSWQMESEIHNTIQMAYKIIVSSACEIVWNSGRVESREQSFIRYQGTALRSCTVYTWQVTVWDNHDNCAASKASFETAFMNADCWQAKWIESSILRPQDLDYRPGNQPPAVRFEKKFSVHDRVRSARFYATAFGVYRPEMNGHRLNDWEFAPEYTAYRKLHYYQTYDITTHLRQGENLLTLYVGDGWYLCPMCQSAEGEHHPYPSVLFQVEIRYMDGSQEMICSDGSEVCRTGPICYSDLYWGSKIDATVQFSTPQEVILRDYSYDQLAAQPMDPVRPMKFLSAEKIYTSPKGEIIVDFGQLLCGRARIQMNVPYGREVVLSYFEQPDLDGNYLNTMFATQKDKYVSDGKPCVFESPFVFYGFRYLMVEGIEHPKPEDFTAVLLTTEKENIGNFSCNEPRVNRLYENIRWSQAGNMLSIPTDCPSREKAGYTGDLQIYASAAMGNEELTPFLTSYLRNLSAEQTTDGVVPIVVPHSCNYDTLIRNHSTAFGEEKLTGVAGWGDAAVIIPYEMYRMTANTLVLHQQFDSMKAWCDYILRTARDERGEYPEEYDRWLWDTGFHFGEWHIPSEKYKPDHSHCKNTARYTAPLFGYRSVSLFAEICEVLKKEESACYKQAAERMKQAIGKTLMSDGKMPAEFMGAYVLAIAFDAVPEKYANVFADHLADIVEKNGCKLDTGFLATAYFLDVLVKIGRADLAEAVFWQSEAPSWLYQVDMGATAMWESWFNLRLGENPGITSFNHYAFGCVDNWILSYICGILPEEPGFRKIRIEPHLGKLKQLERNLRSPYGLIRVKIQEDVLSVTIPCNTTASVIWGDSEQNIGSGDYVFYRHKIICTNSKSKK